ncbi:MAG: Excalibur domain protein [Pseudarthrobacter sp.]|nr:Excalibur domain protein [Pseudarthrobacter sp.]
MKKTLILVVLAGLMLTGCGGTKPASTATAVAVVADAVTVPDVMDLTLDKAEDQLKDLGFKVEAVDTADGKMIVNKKNWQVISQDPTAGGSVAKGSTVHLGVKHLVDEAADKAAADKVAADKAAAEKAAAEAAAAAKAAADKTAADQAAAQLAAEQAAAQQAAAQAAQAAAQAAAQQAAAQPAPQAPAVKAPAAASYANCAAVKAAGAAPLFSGQPGYSTALDRDRDGVACEK